MISKILIKFFKIKNKDKIKSFTLIELLMVIGIISIITSIVIPKMPQIKEKALLNKQKEEFKSLAYALQMYANDNNGEYPPDYERNVAAGLEPYLSGGNWPIGTWSQSSYDWDNWSDPDNPGKRIYQISVRFCPSSASPIGDCKFPNTTWAENFDQFSSVYYCISGTCRSHNSKPVNHPGLCVNCF